MKTQKIKIDTSRLISKERVHKLAVNDKQKAINALESMVNENTIDKIQLCDIFWNTSCWPCPFAVATGHSLGCQTFIGAEEKNTINDFILLLNDYKSGKLDEFIFERIHEDYDSTKVKGEKCTNTKNKN